MGPFGCLIKQLRHAELICIIEMRIADDIKKIKEQKVKVKIVNNLQGTANDRESDKNGLKSFPFRATCRL